MKNFSIPREITTKANEVLSLRVSQKESIPVRTLARFPGGIKGIIRRYCMSFATPANKVLLNTRKEA